MENLEKALSGILENIPDLDLREHESMRLHCSFTVGGEVKFACVDGPDFDGHKVDYDELMSRNSVYRDREAEERKTHICRIQKMGEELIK